MKLEQTNEEKDILMRMNQLRGVLALVVMLSHIWGYTGLVFLVPFNKVVTIAVGFFFFLSGYGMIKSFYIKEKYLRNIICVKIPFLLWMSVFAYVFSVVLELILLSSQKERIFLPISIKQYFMTTNWYVYELLGFYLIFIFVMKFVSEKYQLIVVAGISVIAFVILYNSELVEAYYNSIIGFWIGMFCGRYGCIHIMKKYKAGYIVGWLILVISFVGMFFLDRQSMLFALIRNIAAVGALIVVLYIIRFLDIDVKMMRYLSTISPEIYFYHMPIALILSHIVKNKTLYMFIVIISSIMISIIIHPINQRIQKIIKGVKENEA